MTKDARQTPKVALIIPVFNGMPYLAACLEALAWTASEGVDVVVVDSGSTDGSGDFAKREMATAHVLSANESMWWAAATDLGVRHAVQVLGSTVVGFLNHDCLLSVNAFRRMMAAHEEHPEAIVCGRVVAGGLQTTLAAGGVVLSDGVVTLRGIGAPATTRFPSGQVDWCGGMGAFVNASVLESVGGIDHRRFPHYYADADLCLRLGQAGHPTWYVDDAVVVTEPRSTGLQLAREGATLRDVLLSLTSRRSMYNVGDTLRFYRRHAGRRWPLALCHVYGLWAGFAATRLARGLRSSMRGRRTWGGGARP
jgi:GT2 family glycosyltransferase